MHCHSVSCDVARTKWLIGCDGNDNQFHQQKVLMYQAAFHDLLKVATHTLILLSFFSFLEAELYTLTCLCLLGSSLVSSGGIWPARLFFGKTETSGCLFCYKIKIYCASWSSFWDQLLLQRICYGILHFDLLSILYTLKTSLLRSHWSFSLKCILKFISYLASVKAQKYVIWVKYCFWLGSGLIISPMR